MKEDTRWKLIVGIGLIMLSLALFTVHYLIFHDEHHLFIFFFGDLAFIPIEILIVTLIIDQMLEGREKQRRMEKLNLVIGTFFSTIGTPLLTTLSRADPGIGSVKSHLVIGDNWETGQFRDVQACLDSHACAISGDQIDKELLRSFLLGSEEFIIRIVENPMIFEHESFTELILAINHLTEELKARRNFAMLPPTDLHHISLDIQRVYALLIPEWLKYMRYLKDHYPYLFSLAMRTNPFDDSASVVVKS
jgi:hypothetical protein